MTQVLAYVDASDTSEGNFYTLLLCAGAVLLVCLLAAIVVLVSRRNAHWQADAILTVSIFWGIVSFGSVVYAGLTQMKWSQEHLLELQSGYGDPNAVAPGWPWVFWGVLAGVYVLLLIWAQVLNRPVGSG